MSQTQLILFLVSSLVLIATPGQDMMLVMSRSVSQGSAAGVTTAAGVCLGLLGHTLLAALGLGSLLLASETLFTVLKLAGAAYLIYLGAKLLLTKAPALELQEARKVPLRQLVVQGALSNLSNPKIVIFYFAYLPQFIAPDTAHPTALLLALGAAYAAMGFLVKGPIGYFAGTLSGWLRARPRVLTGINRTSGAVLMALGIKLAFERRA
jgi:threonine/homoserine/homoserine lactone efflux protein